MISRTVKICLILFVVSAGVRLLVWQNNKVEMDGVQWVLTHLYKQDARALVSGDLRLFLAGPNPPSDATVLLHPPGYPLLLAAVYGVAGENEAFRVFQILLNSFSPVLIFLIAAQLFETRTGIIAGFLAALAPQFAYHSGLMLPDALCVLPILAALYFLVLARDRPRLLYAILCGFFLGVSCWFRSNALFLPIFFAAAVFFWLPNPRRGKFSLLLLTAFVLTIAPITIRNYVVFGSFIPLSLGAGTTFIEGLGDYDADGALEMPKTDEGVMQMDAVRAGRPDYLNSLYDPDGVLRDRERLSTGLRVAARHPGWYASSVAHRGLTTLRMERVPAIAPERDERDTTTPILYYLNRPLKLMQSAFITAVFLPLALIGFILVLFDRERRRAFLVLGIVPLYYATVQALIHTEYRYVLATPHLIMIFSAVTLSILIGKIGGRINKDQTSTA